MGLLMFSRAELQHLNVEHPVEIKRQKRFRCKKTELILSLHNLNSVRLLDSSTFNLSQGLIKQFLKDTFWRRLDFLIFGKLQRCTIEVLFNFITMTTIDGFHVTSTSPCWWTKTKDPSLAPFVCAPAIVHYSIVICVSRHWLQATYRKAIAVLHCISMHCKCIS